MNGLLRASLAASLLLVAGCAINPPPAPPVSAMCNFVRYDLEANVPDPSAATPRPVVQQVVEARLAAAAPQPGRPAMLFMSGGSQHGAFGAGFLDEWRLRSPNGQLPVFQVVTGVSTGSILSTLAFIGDTAATVGPMGYAITNERELLTPYLELRNGRPVPASVVRVLRHGAAADLTPLRNRLNQVFDDRRLGLVRDGHRAGRLLMVGAVDVDTGQAVAFDLTEMANRYFETQDLARRNVIRNCYSAAVLASSSAPMAAPPVFIDNRMYMDGGARFGMFSDQVGEVISSRAPALLDPANRPAIYLIANNDLELAPRCGYADQSLCPPAPTPAEPPPHATWNLAELGLRSVDVMENQVYRLSAERIEAQARIAGSPFRFVRLDDAADDHVYTLDDPQLGNGTRSCRDWQALDRQLLNPVQFFPRYMRCLIDYGRLRQRQLNWATGPL